MGFITSIIFLALTTFLTTSGFAESELSFDFRKNIRHSGTVPEGFLWENSLRLPFSYSHSQSRIGIDNGNYVDIAAKAKTSLHYRRGLSDWSSSAFVGESYSVTPTIENRFIKSQDIFRVETRYLYNLRPWLSPYAHARMETSLFKSIDIDSASNDFEIQNPDGSLAWKTSTKELYLADPFRPIFFHENVGVVASIVDKDYLRWEARLAASFRQTIADGQRIFVEEKDDVRIVRKLNSFFQIGPQLGTAFSGSFFDDKVEYTTGIDTMWPAWQRPKPVGRDFFDSLIIEANAGLMLQLTSWSSIGYEYSTIRIPDILPRFQQNHSLTVDISLDWSYAFGAPEGA